MQCVAKLVLAFLHPAVLFVTSLTRENSRRRHVSDMNNMLNY
jgi:hypothetical protein